MCIFIRFPIAILYQTVCLLGLLDWNLKWTEFLNVCWFTFRECVIVKTTDESLWCMPSAAVNSDVHTCHANKSMTYQHLQLLFVVIWYFVKSFEHLVTQITSVNSHPPFPSKTLGLLHLAVVRKCSQLAPLEWVTMVCTSFTSPERHIEKGKDAFPLILSLKSRVPRLSSEYMCHFVSR